ncbi:Transcription factor bHLH93 [Quillaja saponaria]|uniref:Transcription factor bHLH93 n=1 Tax=Quillaja saponaria TaxID=32244 RepID=A0AAD7PL92_QUISA|nr:Transcription factor bHLH93 [Quillaja saponaria]
MELYEHDFFEELLALRRETRGTIPTEMNGLFSNGYSFDCFDQNPLAVLPNSSSQQLSQTFYNDECTFNEVYDPFIDDFSTPQITDSSYNNLDTLLNTPPFLSQEYYPLSLIEEEDPSLYGNELDNLDLQANCKMEPIQSPELPAAFNMGTCLERKKRPKKLQGQPSKNLMAERRRRKKLNDRLSMLRAIVPKISKMDRTSILGDTINYMKELLGKINNLQQEVEVNSNMVGIFKDAKPNEISVRNIPKFDVERRNVDTRIDICCAGKPGLLQSTVNTMEALGLEIQQCVISCFNDFAMQASCSEELEHRTILSSEDIKQSLFKNAGYGGKCL